MKNVLTTIFGFALLAALIYFVYFIVTSIFSWFSGLSKELTIPLITASSTIIVATLTIVLGKYFERIKEIESHHRSKKVEIYDRFLKSIFNTFYQNDPEFDLVKFLQEWQREIMLWANPKVIKAFLKWKLFLGKGEINAQSFFLLEELFKEMRKDIGLSNKNFDKGTFCHLVLKNSELFLAATAKNPNLTLTEFGKMEDALTNNS